MSNGWRMCPTSRWPSRGVPGTGSTVGRRGPEDAGRLDAWSPAGRTADVFLEASRPGVAERPGRRPDDVLGATRGSSTAGSRDGARTGRLPRPPATRSATRRSPCHPGHRSAGGTASTAAPLLGLRRRGPVLGDGMVCALLKVQRSGRVRWSTRRWSTASRHLASVFYSMAASGSHAPERGRTCSTAGRRSAVYECADGGWVSSPHRAPLLRPVAPRPRPHRSGTTRPVRPVPLARLRGRLAQVFLDPDPGPVDGGLQRHRCLRGYRPRLRRGPRPPPRWPIACFPDSSTEVPPVPRLSVTPGGAEGRSPDSPGFDADAVLAEGPAWRAQEIADLADTGAIR